MFAFVKLLQGEKASPKQLNFQYESMNSEKSTRKFYTANHECEGKITEDRNMYFISLFHKITYNEIV